MLRFKHLAFAALAALACVAPAKGDPATQQFADRAITAPCTAACDISVRANGSGTVAVAASGSGSGLTFVWQGLSADGTWVTLPAFNESTQTATQANLSANGQWIVAAAGYQNVRGHLTVIGGGTETFSLNASAAPRSIGVGYPASGSTASGAPVPIGCDYNTAPPTLTNGQRGQIQCGTRAAVWANIIDNNGTAGATVRTPGDAGASAPGLVVDSSNGVYDGSQWVRQRQITNGLNSTGTGIVASGGAAQCDDTSITTTTENSWGSLRQDCDTHDLIVGIGDPTTAANVAAVAFPSADGAGLGTAAGLRAINAPYDFNGSTWDRHFACPSQAAVTVTAGNTTEIVALSASTIIRVCSFSVGMSATGTAKFVRGTGSNCGTGTTDITPATTITSGNVWALSGGDADVLRGASAGALCVAAVTGNAQVFVKYVQY